MPSTDVSTAAASASSTTDVLHLRRGGTSVVLALTSPPSIVHWGEDLGESAADTLRDFALAAAPQRVSGGQDVSPFFIILPTPAI